jgi:hypothetical protein
MGGGCSFSVCEKNCSSMVVLGSVFDGEGRWRGGCAMRMVLGVAFLVSQHIFVGACPSGVLA